MEERLVPRIVELVEARRKTESEAVARYMGITDPDYDHLGGITGPALEDMACKALRKVRRGTSGISPVERVAYEVYQSEVRR